MTRTFRTGAGLKALCLILCLLLCCNVYGSAKWMERFELEGGVINFSESLNDTVRRKGFLVTSNEAAVVVKIDLSNNQVESTLSLHRHEGNPTASDFGENNDVGWIAGHEPGHGVRLVKVDLLNLVRLDSVAIPGTDQSSVIDLLVLPKGRQAVMLVEDLSGMRVLKVELDSGVILESVDVPDSCCMVHSETLQQTFLVGRSSIIPFDIAGMVQLPALDLETGLETKSAILTDDGETMFVYARGFNEDTLVEFNVTTGAIGRMQPFPLSQGYTMAVSSKANALWLFPLSSGPLYKVDLSTLETLVEVPPRPAQPDPEFVSAVIFDQADSEFILSAAESTFLVPAETLLSNGELVIASKPKFMNAGAAIEDLGQVLIGFSEPDCHSCSSGNGRVAVISSEQMKLLDQIDLGRLESPIVDIDIDPANGDGFVAYNSGTAAGVIRVSVNPLSRLASMEVAHFADFSVAYDFTNRLGFYVSSDSELVKFNLDSLEIQQVVQHFGLTGSRMITLDVARGLGYLAARHELIKFDLQSLDRVDSVSVLFDSELGELRPGTVSLATGKGYFPFLGGIGPSIVAEVDLDNMEIMRSVDIERENWDRLRSATLKYDGTKMFFTKDGYVFNPEIAAYVLDLGSMTFDQPILHPAELVTGQGAIFMIGEMEGSDIYIAHEDIGGRGVIDRFDLEALFGDSFERR